MMPDSPDPIELLANAKPVSTYDIEPSRLDEMITRVTSAPAARFPLLRTWQMRAGSALAAAVVAVAAVLVSLGGGPGLTVLTLGSAATISGPATHAPVTPSPTSFATAQAPVRAGAQEKSTFIGGPRLATSASPLAVYRVLPVPDPSASLSNVAAALGVHHVTLNAQCTYGATGTSVLGANAVGTTAVVTEAPLRASGCSGSLSTATGPLTWTYNLKNSECQRPSSLSSNTSVCALSPASSQQRTASPQQLRRWSSRLVTSLRRYDVVPHGMTLGGPSFASGANTVVYPLVTSSGVISNQYEEFQFTIAGSLEYATGLLASTTLDNTYPALSEAGGVALLTHSSGSSVNPGGPMIPAATTTVTVTSPGFEASPKVVTLTSATLSYQLLWLEDGTAVLLPQYIYRASNGVDEQVLALSPTSYRVGAAK
jgi:hypothetical protein